MSITFTYHNRLHPTSEFTEFDTDNVRWLGYDMLNSSHFEATKYYWVLKYKR